MEMSDEEVDAMEETVCVETIAFCTWRRGRQICHPLRLDLYFLLLCVFHAGLGKDCCCQKFKIIMYEWSHFLQRQTVD